MKLLQTCYMPGGVWLSLISSSVKGSSTTYHASAGAGEAASLVNN